ncbi:VOC family protein [Novosphingobium sediminicola]|uniref:Catechol 2,3-dioxygenase-like lactoylglutathione lyase family enzyme n=1 Tax=Novosphingobium sediminicola TaxID=563162 RepID=A0A7W6G514_9SPHN|nr:VOC family protein [Novosphingobium sediminicola]MBB3954219.1 catechol 2,3-dioxygenase-like lactoylglutathione lyase family enzyme [Novosphingobium sediminicola]
MTLLKCATHVVADLDDAVARYAAWMDYAVVERGLVDDGLAALWMAPAGAGRRYALMQPASGAQTFLRFVEGDVVEDYAPIRSYGWAAIELCVTDVEAVNARMMASPFEIIGPPKPLDGFAIVKPMQVKGADKEVVYLTQILAPGAEHGLPAPQSLVDRPFIMVLACPDLRAAMDWARDVLGLEVIDPVAIRYSMIAKSFDLPEGQKTEISTGRWGDHVFLEFDQYPQGACPRPRIEGQLPPGVAITTMEHPDFARLSPHWAVPPAPRQGLLYQGRRTGMLLTPEGALLEVIEA